MDSAKRRRALMEKMTLPAQLLPNEPKLTVCGGEVLIENHGGLMTYTREMIEVRGRSGYMRINGDELSLSAMTPTDIAVRGLIVSIELC